MHDHWFSSLLYGEPFLDRDLPVYFDGHALTLCAYPLAGSQHPDPRTVALWARDWVRRTQADALMLVAPRCPDLRLIQTEGLGRYWTWRAQLIGREMVAPCGSEEASRERRRRARRASSKPYDFRVRRGGSMDAPTLSLVERFQRRIPSTPYLAGLVTAWPAILMSPSVQFLEAWQGNRLGGFIALHVPFATTAVAIAMAREDDAEGVADFLYANMIQHAGTLGCDGVNVGPSTTKGQFRFKSKWAQPSGLPPRMITEWRRAPATKRTYNLWGPRNLRKG